MQRSIDQVNEKLKLLKADRDDQAKQIKKLKIRNDELNKNTGDL